MLMSRGLYEYTWESAGEPRLTLMRAVGRITRGLRCHPAVGAQCHGRLAFEYAIRLFLDGPDAAAAAMREAMEYNLTPLALQTFAEPRKLRPALDFGNPWWMPAALKPREEPPGFVVRFWNAADSPQAGDLRVGLPFARVYRARMDEAPLAEMPFRGDIVPVTAGPKEVVTLVFENRARLAER
jgi:alpha-mannosidase